MDARQSSFDARKSLLRSNPSLYISRTRLSIRQIPLYVTDGMLKRLANYAIREFDRDVKGGHQKPLTADELVTFVPDASGAKESAHDKVERKKGVPLGKVRQSKILRQNDRVDPVTGLGRSKGYGFLELGSHADALRFLRWANANKEVNRLFRTWWREELDKMLEQVEKGEGKLGKGVKVSEKDDRLKRLREKRKELEEEERAAEDKASKREAAGRAVTGEGGRSSKCLIIECASLSLPPPLLSPLVCSADVPLCPRSLDRERRHDQAPRREGRARAREGSPGQGASSLSPPFAPLRSAQLTLSPLYVRRRTARTRAATRRARATTTTRARRLGRRAASRRRARRAARTARSAAPATTTTQRVRRRARSARRRRARRPSTRRRPSRRARG